MSNNAAVCRSGGEIGRSQMLQAIACGVEAETDMNPVLLKPEGDTRSQVVVNGKATPALEAREYFQRRQKLRPTITAALDRLRSKFDFVLIEGAGSPAELNLSTLEMVNLSVARYCQAPTILVGDIERGGVFAQLLGTLWLIPEEDRDLFCGLLVNKFRGDRSLFDSGVEILEERSGVPVLGVLPWIKELNLPEEDAVALNESFTDPSRVEAKLDIAVVHVPHIANFDDFDPLAQEPGVRLRYVRSADEVGAPDVLILPGTKNTIGDLQWLKNSGIADRIVELADRGTRIIGICGGYQILGKSIRNPDLLESPQKHVKGLELLEVDTTYHANKQTRQSDLIVVDDAMAPGAKGCTVSGYEIHVGRTESPKSWLQFEHVADQGGEVDGAYSRGGQVWGCYLHGLFHNDLFRKAFLRQAGADEGSLLGSSSSKRLDESLDRLADAFEAAVDVPNLIRESEIRNSRKETHV